jgi:hypothetical protein
MEDYEPQAESQEEEQIRAVPIPIPKQPQVSNPIIKISYNILPIN